MIKMIVTNRFDPDVRVFKEAKYLVSQGFEVEILCWDRENEYIDREYETIENIKIKRFFPYAKYGSRIKQVKSFIKFIVECKNYLKDKKVHYLHCHDLDGIIVGSLVGKRSAKLIFDMHEIYEIQGYKQKVRWITRGIVNYYQKKSESIIYVHDMQRKFMNKKNAKKALKLPNYPEKKSYYTTDKSQSKYLRISYIGAVRQYEQFKNLMDACYKMSDVKVSIHGAGVAFEKLKAVEKAYENVNITGVYNYSKIGELYSECDILFALYPMRTLQNKIAYPVKFFEAIITGTPIIVSEGSILEKIVKENDIGFVVNPNNSQELRKLIEYINKNKSILMEKKENCIKLQSDYVWENVVGTLDKIYQ